MERFSLLFTCRDRPDPTILQIAVCRLFGQTLSQLTGLPQTGLRHLLYAEDTETT